jgi:hypothetical protein
LKNSFGIFSCMKKSFGDEKNLSGSSRKEKMKNEKI